MARPLHAGTEIPNNTGPQPKTPQFYDARDRFTSLLLLLFLNAKNQIIPLSNINFNFIFPSILYSQSGLFSSCFPPNCLRIPYFPQQCYTLNTCNPWFTQPHNILLRCKYSQHFIYTSSQLDQLVTSQPSVQKITWQGFRSAQKIDNQHMSHQKWYDHK